MRGWWELLVGGESNVFCIYIYIAVAGSGQCGREALGLGAQSINVVFLFPFFSPRILTGPCSELP